VLQPGKNSKMAAKNQDSVTFFYSCKNSNETPTSGLCQNNFLMQIGWKLSGAPQKSNKTIYMNLRWEGPL
jgi:hypothetical protein